MADESALGMSGDAERRLLAIIEDADENSPGEVCTEFANEITRLRGQRSALTSRVEAFEAREARLDADGNSLAELQCQCPHGFPVASRCLICTNRNLHHALLDQRELESRVEALESERKDRTTIAPETRPCLNQYRACSGRMTLTFSDPRFVLFTCPECRWVETEWVDDEHAALREQIGVLRSDLARVREEKEQMSKLLTRALDYVDHGDCGCGASAFVAIARAALTHSPEAPADGR